MDLSIQANWTSLFPVLGVSDVLFLFLILFYLQWEFLYANSVDPDQTLPCAASDLGLHCLPRSRWATSWQNQQNGMCAQQTLRSAWASAQSLGIRPVWSESLLSTWKKLVFLATHWVHREDSDQTGRMPRLIWMFAWHTCHFVGLPRSHLWKSRQERYTN